MMSRFFSFQRAVLFVATLLAAGSVSAFSLLGPPDVFQVERIGYMTAPPIGADIGAPQNLGEEYRYNLRTITYGFDYTFKVYFGQKGVDEVRKAMDMLNALPPMSKMSTDLREFSTNTRRVNYRASALGLLDLKSWALAAMVENLGLASPERYTWCLSARLVPAPFAYNVIKRNFDPVTLAPSSYVNDVLYTYFIPRNDPIPGLPRDVIDALELPVDPQAFQYTSVASVFGTWAVQPGGDLFAGDFLVGLTRDDVGGLRYLYAGKGPYINNNNEILVSDVSTNGAGGGSPWAPVGNLPIVNLALRPGVDKLTFKEAKYDSTLGQFIITTNNYKDTFIQGNGRRTQAIQRVVAEPDIIFGAGDLGGGVILRTLTQVDLSATNAQVILNGPGIIETPTFIVFNKTGPFYINQQFDFLDEQSAVLNFIWGSYDGTTNEPFIYPAGSSIQELEQQVLSGN